MIRLLGLLIILLGVAVAATPHVSELRDWLPSALQNGLVAWQAYAAGAIVSLIGLLLLKRTSSSGKGLSDQAIRSIFQRRRFAFTAFPDGGWQARGNWNNETITVRWECGYHAGRFGRPWVLVATLPGRPAQPLPLSPTQAMLADTLDDRFSVVLPEAGLADGHSTIVDRIDQLLLSRQ